MPAPTAANLMQVSGGCGPAFHRTPWGYCVVNQYGYGYTGWYGYHAPAYGWGYYHPRWHYWHY